MKCIVTKFRLPDVVQLKKIVRSAFKNNKVLIKIIVALNAGGGVFLQSRCVPLLLISPNQVRQGDSKE